MNDFSYRGQNASTDISVNDKIQAQTLVLMTKYKHRH
jgi:hypothetical protein